MVLEPCGVRVKWYHPLGGDLGGGGGLTIILYVHFGLLPTYSCEMLDTGWG